MHEENAYILHMREVRKVKTIVFTNGVFDILHAGHIHILEQAKRLGDILIVGINSDESVGKLNKGAGRPFNDHLQRAAVVDALDCVDDVVVYHEETPLDTIRLLRPHVLVKGEDWAEKGVVGREEVEADGGKVVLVPVLEGYSTTSIIEKILATCDCKGIDY